MCVVVFYSFCFFSIKYSVQYLCWLFLFFPIFYYYYYIFFFICCLMIIMMMIWYGLYHKKNKLLFHYRLWFDTFGYTSSTTRWSVDINSHNFSIKLNLNWAIKCTTTTTTKTRWELSIVHPLIQLCFLLLL